MVEYILTILEYRGSGVEARREPDRVFTTIGVGVYGTVNYEPVSLIKVYA